jgi:hypothetical protein
MRKLRAIPLRGNVEPGNAQRDDGPQARSPVTSELPTGRTLVNAPLILASRIGNRREVFAANAAAQALGLRVGMPVTKAQAMVPDLIIKDAEPVEDARGLESLALYGHCDFIRRSSRLIHMTDSSLTPPVLRICMAARPRCWRT